MNRDLITKKVLYAINSNFTKDDFLSAKKTWWMNIRKTGGMGLTLTGKEAFEKAEIEYWDLEIKVGDIISPMNKLKLDRFLPCPYYLLIQMRKPKVVSCIRIYNNSTVVIMSQLYGNFKLYLDSLIANSTDFNETLSS